MADCESLLDQLRAVAETSRQSHPVRAGALRQGGREASYARQQEDLLYRIDSPKEWIHRNDLQKCSNCCIGNLD